MIVIVEVWKLDALYDPARAALGPHQLEVVFALTDGLVVATPSLRVATYDSPFILDVRGAVGGRLHLEVDEGLLSARRLEARVRC